MRSRQEQVNAFGSVFLNEVPDRVTYRIGPAPSLSSTVDRLIVCTAGWLQAKVMAHTYLLFTKVGKHIWREIKGQSQAYRNVLANF